MRLRDVEVQGGHRPASIHGLWPRWSRDRRRPRVRQNVRAPRGPWCTDTRRACRAQGCAWRMPERRRTRRQWLCAGWQAEACFVKWAGSIKRVPIPEPRERGATCPCICGKSVGSWRRRTDRHEYNAGLLDATLTRQQHLLSKTLARTTHLIACRWPAGVMGGCRGRGGRRPCHCRWAGRAIGGWLAEELARGRQAPSFVALSKLSGAVESLKECAADGIQREIMD